MIRVKFGLDKGTTIEEIVEFDEGTTVEEIEQAFTEWVFDKLDAWIEYLG